MSSEVTVSQAFIKFFTSLKLTVVLLVLSMLLVFIATIAQVQLGIHGVLDRYFRTFFVMAFVGENRIPLPWFPGGYLIGGFLLINLIASHLYRFKITWKKAGIQLTHFGLIVLLVGELVTGILQEEFALTFNEGETKSYSEAFRDNEVVIIDTTDADEDVVTAIPESVIADGDPIQHGALPFRVLIHGYYANADLTMRNSLPADSTPPGMAPNIANQGIGPRIAVFPKRYSYDDNDRNLPVAILELVGTEGSIGTWLVSPMLPMPQTFEYAGRSFRIGMRFTREYKPFAMKLIELKHDVYPGSQIPKNFSSRVHVTALDGSEDREALIYMNHPLRYQGYTFYQFQMDSANGMSRLQVVRNPGYMMPYIATILMTLGLLLQFGIHLVKFTQRRTA
ncbi:cytochrome c biogenesis protein ResB [Actomonas aquatica]|uniref:Cytochrome c biogenesis protein ResB n=1 Tax=Actomonas aquatica TaxID=2866162 RepID=A0ABZ1CFM1_9BACT|nr:cytochrome c biogenesis protein ResB [Opitutus sp. WL0086]WRQ89085.1 cytochrome c biogenesis protein ResB [Opitutus sp. WL0086]